MKMLSTGKGTKMNWMAPPRATRVIMSRGCSRRIGSEATMIMEETRAAAYSGWGRSTRLTR